MCGWWKGAGAGWKWLRAELSLLPPFSVQPCDCISAVFLKLTIQSHVFTMKSTVFSLSETWLRGQDKDSCRYEHWPFQTSLKSDLFQGPWKTNQVSKHLKPKLQNFNYSLNSDPYTCPQTLPSSYPASDLSWYHLCTALFYPSCKDWLKCQFHKKLFLITPPCHRLHPHPHLHAGKNNFSCHRFPKPFMTLSSSVLIVFKYISHFLSPLFNH